MVANKWTGDYIA